ncbi:Hypothetical predicted protein [Mytilus galloprovincialis]|uniref:Chromo domain-containing protein n=1 Tax=Mytilus galloprovincialis TaxID=29158 RepID=A0A8B6C808_MYTGA|nr:Hypothetical predicted protein [Mytilus galloprovincialis]
MDGKTYLQHVATEWRKKSTAAKETYAKQAEEIRADPFKGQDREGVIAFNLKAIHAACEVLESVGFEIGGFGVDPTEEVNPVVFSSRGALSFFNRKLQENFQTYVTGKTQVGSKDLDKKDLQQLVRKQVNTAWAKTSTSTKCPYKDVKDGKVDVEIQGLPDNVGLKDPSWYGIKTLKTMLDSNIEFKIRQNPQNQTIDEVVKTTQESKARNEVHNSTVLEKTGCSTAGTSIFASTDANRNKDTNECNEDAKRKLEKNESSTEDELYTIEKIIKERKKKNNKTEVLVKWEGYSKPSWVDKTEIKNIKK